VAQEGHPYYTKELDRIREEQRVILASLPDEIFVSTNIAYMEAVRAKDPSGAVETTLRRLAQSSIDQAPVELLERSARRNRKRALRDWARHVDQGGGVLDLVRDEAQVPEDEESGVRQLAQANYDVLARVAMLLVWADDLAGDYVDARVRQWRKSRTAR
jgi:hypothetical protein